MGFLLPLYLAGLGALSLPFILHLVRRTPRGRQNFSSLMFLSPTIPKLTRRSRMDQLLLLFLRLAALALIVFAFSRPFLREASLLSLADLAGRRVALMVDTSASMRRGDLWPQAIKAAEKELDELNPQDDVALFTFSNRLQTIIDFAKKGSGPIANKPEVVRQKLRELKPDWAATDLGTALTTVAGELDSTTDLNQTPLDPSIVVISDFQAGSQIQAIQSFEWPKRIPVVPRRVEPPDTTNAFVRLLPNEEGDELTESRVRVANASDSKRDQFFLSWSSGSPAIKKANETAVYVPAGQSRIVRLSRTLDDLAADRIVLRGDDQDFDNTYWVVPPLKQAASVLYVGTDPPDQSDGIQYFLRLAVANDPLRQVDIKTATIQQSLIPPGEQAPGLIVVSRAISAEWQAELATYVDRGGTLLLVPENREAAESVFKLLDDVQLGETSEAKNGTEKYLLLGDINFTHPLFTTFASPRYNDFTKIHFWNHFPVTLKSPAQTRIVARFDNGVPALIERTVQTGRILGLMSGWQPRDSQFAVSSKFVPFIGSLLDLACGGVNTAAGVEVSNPVTITTLKDSNSKIAVQKPDGSSGNVAAARSSFTGTDLPGIYLARTSPLDTRFAVNLSASESNTAPLDLEQLEQSGVKFGAELTRDERVERIRQQRDTELEGRQKVWRWLLVLAIVVLIVESWLAGRAEQAVRILARKEVTQ